MENAVQTGQEVRRAERADFGPWLDLAREVEPLFGPMARDPVFQRALLRNIARGTAFCVREHDDAPGSALVGGLLLSPRPPVYRVGWLAVRERDRRRGVGRMLLEFALTHVVPPADLVVVTFGPDVAGGELARAFYQKMGFVPAEMAEPAQSGASRQIFRKQLAEPAATDRPAIETRAASPPSGRQPRRDPCPPVGAVTGASAG